MRRLHLKIIAHLIRVFSFRDMREQHPDRQTDRQTDRDTYRQTDRQTDGAKIFYRCKLKC